MESIDLNHWRGAEIASQLQRNADEANWLQMIHYLKPSLQKEGNQWVYILGKLPESNCVVGFGDSPREAMISFCTAFNTNK